MAPETEHLTCTLWVPMLLFYIQQVFILYPTCSVSVQTAVFWTSACPAFARFTFYCKDRKQIWGWVRESSQNNKNAMQGPGKRRVVETECVSSVRPIFASRARLLWLLLPSLGCIPPHTKQNSRGELMEQALTESGIIAQEINSAL